MHFVQSKIFMETSNGRRAALVDEMGAGLDCNNFTV